MLFLISRLAFGSLIFVVGFFLLRKSRVIYKKKYFFILLIMSVIFTTVSALIPIENDLITFSSPQSAYNYSNLGKIKLILDGEKTSFVVGEKSDTNNYSIVPKSNGGWKLGMKLDTEMVYQKIYNGITIYVYQYKNTNDYYIVVSDTNGNPLNITDTLGSDFQCLNKSNNQINMTIYTYFAYIKSFDEQYTLNLNSDKIKLLD